MSDHPAPERIGGPNDDERELLIARLEHEVAVNAATIESLSHQLDIAAQGAGWAVLRRLWRISARLRRGDSASSTLASAASGHGPTAADGFDPPHAARALLAGSRAALKGVTGDVRVIAFYLPQFHPIPENDRWWGRGFTEWTNVAAARPNFAGHDQPHLPADLGFYDLRVPEVREQQAELAREHGIHGFCYYHYWFNGHRVLERPFAEVLASGRPRFPFCVCWANENWTRRWDGGDDRVLIAQDSSVEDDRRFIRDLVPALRDPRYIRVDGRPLLIVYRLDRLADPRRTAEVWREEADAAGVGDLYLCCAQVFGTIDPRPHGFDAALEFPPLTAFQQAPMPCWPGALVDRHPRFSGAVLDYLTTAIRMADRPAPEFTMMKGVMPRWDNTARRQLTGIVFLGSTPEAYEYWLGRAVEHMVTRYQGDERLVFVNAWNEWSEGAHLEPDRAHGRRYLEATRNVVRSVGAMPAR